MLEKVLTPNQLLKVLASTIGENKKCPLQPTISSLHIHDVSHYINRFHTSRPYLVGIATQILIYAYDIVLISENTKGLKRHLNAFKYFVQKNSC